MEQDNTERHIAPSELQEILEIISFTPVDGGHMMYDKCLVETPVGNYFVKTSDDSLLSDQYQAQRMREYLIKEQCAYDIVGRHQFTHIPDSRLHNYSLILEAHTTQDGWLWEAPVHEPEQYINDVLHALHELEQIPAAEELLVIDPEPSITVFLRNGWAAIGENQVSIINDRLKSSADLLHPHVANGIGLVRDLLDNPVVYENTLRLQAYVTRPTALIAHHDARQSNIAWHPEHGVRLVDWSWASSGHAQSDTTMLLIDLHKSNLPILEYTKDYFDPEYAMLLIGYWLARCVEPSPSEDNTVRFHQLASAVSAVDLLAKL